MQMPTGPKGEKRPADVIGNAVHVMRVLTGEIEDAIPDDGKDPAAKSLGKKGGAARAKRAAPLAAPSRVHRFLSNAMRSRIKVVSGRYECRLALPATRKLAGAISPRQ
jgi:hypothetical protein